MNTTIELQYPAEFEPPVQADTSAPDPLCGAGMTICRNGTVILSGAAEALFRAWIAHLRRTLEPFADDTMASPAFIDRETLDAVQYAEHFPQHLIHGRAKAGATELCMTPAACYHLYPMLRRRPNVAAGRTTIVCGPCARYEDGGWNPPFRLAGFNMLELVAVGPREYVDAKHAEAVTLIEPLFTELRIPGSLVAASDPFFRESGRGAKLMQRLKELKKEYLMPCESGPVALASVNRHDDSFGRRFGIEAAGGEPAHSFCLAFGLERLTAAGLLSWGASPETWPEALRS